MNTTTGGFQTDLSSNYLPTTGYMYITRFVSPPIYTTSPTAQTWTLNIAAWRTVGANALNYPGKTTTHVFASCLYVWRPSTGALVGTIFDADSATGSANFGTASTATSCIVTFTGSAVTITNGDVLCFEALTYTNNTATHTPHYGFDGTTVTTTDNTAVTSHASFIETPDTLSFIAPTTVTGKTVTNKLITKV